MHRTLTLIAIAAILLGACASADTERIDILVFKSPT